MGAMYADHFSRAGFRTLLLAHGDRADRLRSRPITVNGHLLDAEVIDPLDGDSGPPSADLVMVAVKHAHLGEAVELIRPVLSPDTTILSVLNGLDSEEIVLDLLRRPDSAVTTDQVPLCIALAMDAEREGHEVRYTQAGRLVLGLATTDDTTDGTHTTSDGTIDGTRTTSGGTADGTTTTSGGTTDGTDATSGGTPPGTARVAAVQDALTRAGLAWSTPDDMRHQMWWKFMVNVGINQASAVLRAPYGAFQHPGPAYDLKMALIGEVRAVAAAEGVALTDDDVTRWHTVLAGQPADGMTSMHQDVLAGRPTEVDIFAGRIVALGQRHGIPVPHNETMLWILRALGAARDR
jgi:2-dehydropantoate 2-reductase